MQKPCKSTQLGRQAMASQTLQYKSYYECMCGIINLLRMSQRSSEAQAALRHGQGEVTSNKRKGRGQHQHFIVSAGQLSLYSSARRLCTTRGQTWLRPDSMTRLPRPDSPGVGLSISSADVYARERSQIAIHLLQDGCFLCYGTSACFHGSQCSSAHQSSTQRVHGELSSI